jgi:hypothetical protein
MFKVKSAILLLIICCSCSRSNSENTVFHRQKDLHKASRFNVNGIGQRTTYLPKIGVKIKSLQPHKKLDHDLDFKVSQRFKKKPTQSWDIPEVDESEDDSIFLLRPKKTKSTIKIELKKNN